MKASSQSAVAAARRRERALRFREEQDIAWVLSDERGRRFLHGLMEGNGLHADIPIGTNETYVRIGMRAVALAVRRAVKHVADASMLQRMEAEWLAEPDPRGAGADPSGDVDGEA